jgi:hypothetical protein
MSHMIRVGLVILVAVLTGCSKSFTVKVSPAGAVNSIPVSLEGQVGAPKYSAVIRRYDRTYNGNSVVFDESSKNRLAQMIGELGIFRSIALTGSQDSQSAQLDVFMQESYNPSGTTLFVKGFLVGASFLVLAPVIPIYLEQTTTLTVRVQKPDSSSRDYSVSATVEGECYFFSIKGCRSELPFHGFNAAARELMTRMAAERAWLQQ